MWVSYKSYFGSIACLLLVAPHIGNAQQRGDVTEAQCTPKDFSERFGPIRDQGNSAFCYAFASADIVGEALELQSKIQLSGMYLGTQFMSMTSSEIAIAKNRFASENNGNTIDWDPEDRGYLDDKEDGGSVDLMLSHAMSLKKMCTESDFPSKGRQFLGLFKDPNFIKKKISKTVSDTYKDPDMACQENATSDAISKLREAQSDILQNSLKKIREVAQEKCSLQVDFTGLKVRSENFPHSDEMPAGPSRYLMDILSKNRPFVISYDPNILFDQEHQAFGGGGRHASVVTGRYWDKTSHTCMIQVRNSSSKTCTHPDKSVKCKDGVWDVPISRLVEGSPLSISWIERPSSLILLKRASVDK
jgi:hypothetical protein